MWPVGGTTRGCGIPSGNSHSQIAHLAAALSLATVTYLGYPFEALALAVGVVVGDAWLSPDLDSDKCNALRRWGPFKFIWEPYQRLPHRHWASHWPVISDAIRVLYLAVPALLTIFLACLTVSLGRDRGLQRAVLDTFWAVEQVQGFVMAHSDLSQLVFGGFCLATALHSTADAIVSESKKIVDFGEPKKRKG